MGPLGRRLLVWVGATVLIGACGSSAPSVAPTSPSAATSSAASASASVAASAPAPSATTPVIAGPIADSGAIALLGHDGSLSLVGADGRSRVLADVSRGTFGFPTWSPDGSRIATVRSGRGQVALVVFDPKAGAVSQPVVPRVIFSKPAAEPFYLFWTPDSQAVSFLSTEAGDLSLRIAPADGSAPLDGSGPGAVVRSGNPFYYDWIGRDRLLAHIGVGTDAFLGEMGLDGDAVGRKLGTPGDFRSAVVSRDRKSIAFVRDGGGKPATIVVASRDGSGEHSMQVFGSAAIQFDPAGATLGAIGAATAEVPVAFPLGPLRLMDTKTGKVRTLIDGLVVIFWWSPDGKTIAALRVQPRIASGVQSPEPSPAEPQSEVRLMFVDVTSGKVSSQPIVHLGATFVNGYVAFFDQYALSHHVWAPDGASILLPESDDLGVSHVTVRYADGRDPVELDGEIGFWSP
jgi:WD40 repeat protein